MALPELTGEINFTANDQAFDQVTAKAAKANQVLTGTQRAMQQLTNHLALLNTESRDGSFFDAAGKKLGISDIINRLPKGSAGGATTIEEIAESYSNYITNAKMAAEMTERFGTNIEKLGQANLGTFTNKIDEMRDKTDALINRQATLEAAKPPPKKGLDQEVDFANIARQGAAAIPGFSPMEGQMLAKLFEILPPITLRTALFAGALGVMGAAAVGAVAGINSAANAIREFEQTQNLKQKIGVTFETADVDGAISEVQADLDSRLSKEKVMQILLQVDPTSAIADLDKFGALAAVVQGYADSFGLNWEQSFTGIAEAIEGGNGAYLEQVGAIGSADAAYLNYAKSQGKNVSQLTALEKQQALYNAVLEKLGPLADTAAGGVDHLRDSNEQIQSALADAAAAFGNWTVALLDPQASSMADWWAGKLDSLTTIFRTFEQELNQSASESRVAVTLSPEDGANFDALREARDNTNASLISAKANLANAEGQGNDALAEEVRNKIEDLERRLGALNTAIDQAKDNAAAGIPISPVVSGDAADQATLDTLNQQREIIIASIKSTKAQMLEAAFAQDTATHDKLATELDYLEERSKVVGSAIEEATADALNEKPIAQLAPGNAGEEVYKLQAEYAKKLADEQALLVLSTLAVKQAQDELSAEDFAAAFNAGDTDTLNKNETSVSNAVAMQTEAQARMDLLRAEQSYMIAHAQLEAAQIEGNASLVASATANENAAAETLSHARESALAVGQIDAWVESINRVGPAFEASIAAAKASGPNLVPVDQWTAAIDGFRTGLIANPVVVPTVMGPATQAEATIINPGDGDSARFDNEGALAESTQATAEATQQAVASSNLLLVTRNAVKAATTEVKAAEDAYNVALASGTASQQNAALVSLNTAKAKQLTAQEAAKAALAQYEEAKALFISTTALGNNAQANEESAAANRKNAQATDQNADALLRTSQVAGMAVDAVSGLPVAFDTAALNAKQLEAALVDLEIQLMNIESAAANVGFSIAQRLVPSMGISGALQQGTEWAGQARQVRESFEGINDARLAQGEDPYGQQVLDTAMNALTDNWQAYATDATASMDQVGGAGKDHAKEMEQVASQINDALDGMVRGVLKDSTSGLIDLDALLPRVDTVDENARRMADVAVKGFQSPWYEGLKGMFSPDVFAGGEAAVKTAAANMVREHQKGLSTMLFDADAAAQQVFEQIQAKQRTDEFVAEIREKVKALGADVEGFDIKTALGIELNDDDQAARAGGAARKSALSQVLSFEEIIAQMQTLGQATESPLVGLLEPKEENNEKIKATGKDTITIAGEAMVSQATDGKYGEKSITAIVSQLKTKEVEIKAAGVTLADWLGGSMVTRFESNVPSGLLDILVTNLIPLMAAQQAGDKERTSSTTNLN